MADETKTLAWRLIIQTEGVEKNTRQAANSLAKMEGAVSQVTKGLGALGIVASAAAVAKLAVEAIKVADAYAAMANTLRQSTSSAAELQAVQVALIDQAHESSTTVEAATENFNKLHDATEGLGMSQQEVIDLSKVLSDTMRLSGMSAEQAQAGVAAFANTLEDGEMNLKEFKAAFKESPELIKALQAGLGKTKDELRLMAEQGQLTTEMLIEGLGKAAPEVAARVAEMGPTISGAMKSAASSFAAMIGEFAEGAGLTSNIARAVEGWGNTFKEWAKNAQLFGIAIKVAVGTVTIEVMSMIDGTVQMLKHLGIQYLRLVDFLTGSNFKDKLDKWAKESSQRLDFIAENRAQGLKDLRDEADAAVAALSGAGSNLNIKGAVADKALTDDQVKTIADFVKALDSLKKKSIDAVTELTALRIELKSGKQVADAYRAQVLAVQAGLELEAQMRAQFTKDKIPIGPEQLAQIAEAVDTQTKMTATLRLNAEAWTLVQSAMNGAMTDQEKANKQVAELAAAFAVLKDKMNPEQIALVQRALVEASQKADQFAVSLKAAMTELQRQVDGTTGELEALHIEMEQGVGAADAFRAQLKAADVEEEVFQRIKKMHEDAKKTFGPEAQEEARKMAQALAEGVTSLDAQAAAWKQVNGAMSSGMTDTQRATMEVNQLNEAMELLESEGLKFSDEQKAAFKKTLTDIKDGADMVKQAWKEAGRSLVDNFIDLLADGEFDMKKFAQNMIREISRIIIQLMVMKSLSGTKFGNFIGVPAANGEAFSHGRLVPMASGGIVTAPTLFPMANGGTGLMGEAGPEAVMPLARLSSGKLGVSAQPANIQVVNNTGVQASARIERSQNRTSIILEAAQLGAQMAEERMTRSMRSGYGATSNALQKTYALRRRG